MRIVYLFVDRPNMSVLHVYEEEVSANGNIRSVNEKRLWCVKIIRNQLPVKIIQLEAESSRPPVYSRTNGKALRLVTTRP